MEGEGRGEKRKLSFAPFPLPPHSFFFCCRHNFLDELARKCLLCRLCFTGLLSRFMALACLLRLVALSVPVSNSTRVLIGPGGLRALKTSYVTYVACLFRLKGLRTSYVINVVSEMAK